MCVCVYVCMCECVNVCMCLRSANMHVCVNARVRLLDSCVPATVLCLVHRVARDDG